MKQSPLQLPTHPSAGSGLRPRCVAHNHSAVKSHPRGLESAVRKPTNTPVPTAESAGTGSTLRGKRHITCYFIVTHSPSPLQGKYSHLAGSKRHKEVETTYPRPQHESTIKPTSALRNSLTPRSKLTPRSYGKKRKTKQKKLTTELFSSLSDNFQR